MVEALSRLLLNREQEQEGEKTLMMWTHPQTIKGAEDNLYR